MKKMISILLSVLLILPFGASFGIPSAAEATYAELWERKRAYETENRYVSLGMEYIVYVCYGDDYGEGGNDESVYKADFNFIQVDDYEKFPEAVAALL